MLGAIKSWTLSRISGTSSASVNNSGVFDPMPISYRLLIAALVALLISLNPQHGRAQNSESNGEHSNARPQSASSLINGKGQERTVTNKPACDSSHNQGEEAICISRIQAQEAGDANDISRSALWWSKTGIIIVGATLAAAVFAASYARRAAIATHEGVEQGRITSFWETRPWVDISVSLYDSACEATDLSVFFQVNFSNTGKTPALNAKWSFKAVARGPVEGERELDLREPIDGEVRVIGTIIPQATLLDSDYAAFEWGEGTLIDPYAHGIVPFVGVRVTYDMPNGREGVTERWFRFYCNGKYGAFRMINENSSHGDLRVTPSCFGEFR